MRINNVVDKNNEPFYPITHERAICDDNGTSLETKIQSLEESSVVAKDYAPSSYSGLGRVVLQKNVKTVGGVTANYLESSMLSTANTIYVVQYDYKLSGTISMPSGCVIELEGGSINGGTLNCNNTTFVGVKTSNHTVALTGTYKDETTNKVRADINSIEATLDDTYTKEEVNSLVTTPEVQYVTVEATSATTSATELLPESGSGGTIYRIGKWDGSAYNVTCFSEYGWAQTMYVLLDVKEYGIDDEPTAGSQNLVKSGGVFDSVMTNGSAFDISTHFASGGVLATYADLSAALTALNALSASYKKGGMSIKYVQSSDNNYVQARLMANEFTTDINQWQSSTSQIKEDSKDLAESGGIFNIISQLSIDYKFQASDKYFPLNVSLGDIISIDSISCLNSNGYSYLFAEVEEGSIAFIKTFNNTDSAKAYAITNASGQVIEVANGPVDGTVIMPSNSKWLIVNTKVSVGGYVKIINRNVIDNIEKLVNSETNICGRNDIRNGAPDDTTANNQVTTRMIPVFGATRLVIITNRPNRAGCSYRYGYCYSQSEQDINSLNKQSDLIGPASALRMSPDNILNCFEIPNLSKCINISIAEYNDNNPGYTQLKIEDFSGYYIKLIFDNGFSYFLNAKTQIQNKTDILNADGIINELGTVNIHYAGDLNNGYYNLSSAVVGQAYSVEVTSSSNYTGIILDVSEGELFSLTTSSTSTNAKAYAILDNNDIVLSTQKNYNGLLRIPSGGTKLIANTKVVSGNDFVVRIFGKFKEFLTPESLNLQIRLNETDQYVDLTNAQEGSKLGTINIISANTFGYKILKVTSGERYQFKTSGNTTSAKSYALVDTDFNVLSLKKNAGDYTIDIQEEGWLILNSKYNNYGISLYDGARKTIFNGEFETISAKSYDIARYNNKEQFDEVQIGQLYAGGIRLGYERNIPRKGSAINVDVKLSYALSQSSSFEQITKRCVPYLYWNQQKIGTIVLFDDVTGMPFIYNKDGEKVFLAVTNS